MRLMSSWVRAVSIAISGKRGGGRAGRMDGVIEHLSLGRNGNGVNMVAPQMGQRWWIKAWKHDLQRYDGGNGEHLNGLWTCLKRQRRCTKKNRLEYSTLEHGKVVR